MVVDIEMQTDAVLVTPVGDVDILTAPELGEALRTAVDAGMRTVVVDLSRVPFMDSAGLGQLALLAREVEQGTVEVQLRNPVPVVAKILKLTRLDSVLRVMVSEGRVDEKV